MIADRKQPIQYLGHVPPNSEHDSFAFVLQKLRLLLGKPSFSHTIEDGYFREMPCVADENVSIIKSKLKDTLGADT